MDFAVNYKQASSRDEAFLLAKAEITPEYIEKFKVKAEVNLEPVAGLMTAKGKGFTLKLLFEEDKCTVDLSLSMLLRPLKKKILSTIEKKLEKHI